MRLLLHILYLLIVLHKDILLALIKVEPIANMCATSSGHAEYFCSVIAKLSSGNIVRSSCNAPGVHSLEKP